MISVIVPVYKTEKYLKKCVDAILKQTYTDFELILVDDGSPDRCPEICDELANLDDRVSVLHKPNGGPSEARNCGVKESIGEYITFIDSDDLVHPRYLETLVYINSKYNADISCVKLGIVHEDISINMEYKGKEILFSGDEAVINMLYQRDIDTSPCAVLVKRGIIENNPFPVGKYHEDDFTTYKYFLDAQRVVIYTGMLYFYVQRPESIMHSTGKVNYDEIDASNHLVDVFANKGHRYYRAAVSKRFSNFCQLVLNHGELEIESPDIYYYIVNILRKDKWRVLFDYRTRLKNKLAAVSLLFGVVGLEKVNGFNKKWKLR